MWRTRMSAHVYVHSKAMKIIKNFKNEINTVFKHKTYFSHFVTYLNVATDDLYQKIMQKLKLNLFLACVLLA